MTANSSHSDLILFLLWFVQWIRNVCSLAPSGKAEHDLWACRFKFKSI